MPLRITIDRFIAQETQHGLSIDDLVPTLRKHGYATRLFSQQVAPPSIEQLLLGRWVVMGRYPHFGHAIALCDGHVIESITQRAIFLLATWLGRIKFSDHVTLSKRLSSFRNNNPGPGRLHQNDDKVAQAMWTFMLPKRRFWNVEK
jgi:hypothetical protein